MEDNAGVQREIKKNMIVKNDEYLMEL